MLGITQAGKTFINQEHLNLLFYLRREIVNLLDDLPNANILRSQIGSGDESSYGYACIELTVNDYPIELFVSVLKPAN